MKPQYFGHLMWITDSLEGLWWQEGIKAAGGGTIVDEKVGWHLNQCIWGWVNSVSWWWTGRPGMRQFMGMQKFENYWFTKLNSTEHDPVHQNKNQLLPQLVSPIEKLPQASYPYLSEGKQNENHNHRKQTKLITWSIDLSNSMKPWAMQEDPPKDGS